MKKVFISYSHDSVEHRERVLALSERLRDDGIETILDQYVNGSPEQGWPRWMLDQLDAADSVLVVCTETYYRRFRGHEQPGKGKGVDWEGALITQEIYDARNKTLKFIPILFGAVGEQFIPEPLRSLTHYTINSEANYQNLYDFILGVAGVEPRPVGKLKPRERHHGTPLRFDKMESATSEAAVDISRIFKYAPAELIGREAELKLLNDAYHGRADLPVRPDIGAAQQRRPIKPKILTFVALGGEGKTSLVAKWAAELAAQEWPGCDAAFAWSFYSQGTREQQAASSDLFLKEALTFFGDDADKEFAASSAGAYEKGQRLARIVGQRRSLLILDGLEPLQYAPTSPTPGQIKDQGIAALLKGLAAASHGLCVVTTRYSLPDLRAFWQTTAPEVKLLRLSCAAAVHLLKSFGVHGSERRTIPLKDGDENSEKVNEFEKLVEDVKGHALTLTLLGSYLHDAHGGDIRKRDLVKLDEANEEELAGHTFHVMDAYVRWLESDGAPVSDPASSATDSRAGSEIGAPNSMGQRVLAILRLLGLFDRPAAADCLEALWMTPAIAGLTEPLVGLTEAQRSIALQRLEDAKLLTVNRDANGALVTLDAHPHIREYFAKQLREGRVGIPLPAAGKDEERRARSDDPYQTSEAWRAAHRRLYEHLCKHREGDQPTLEELQPLYQAVAHGCQAGLQQEVFFQIYRTRIYRAKEFYSTKKLGAFEADLGALACFFDRPWTRLAPSLEQAAQGNVLSMTSLVLRSLGRLSEALEPTRAVLDFDVKLSDWQSAAVDASNLSELELTLGEVAGAVGDAEESVTYADRSGDLFERVSDCSTLADALHQAGRRAEAEACFRDAEGLLAKQRLDFPLLYSVQGFQYCELLLACPERAAWQVFFGRAELPLRPDSTAVQQHRPTAEMEQCRVVFQRAAQTIKIAERNNWPLDIALDHLTMGRAVLYAAILDGRALLPQRQAEQQLGPTDDAFETARRELDAAVAGLRCAGQQIMLPHALLIRAWLRFLTGARTGPGSAQKDLDEAWEIAERGPMKLHMADILLHRARLFFREANYPWESPATDLAAAEKLINACGYHRRDEELADAKKAILGLVPLL